MQCQATIVQEKKAMRKPNLPNGTASFVRELQGENAALLLAVRKSKYRPTTKQILRACRADSLRTYRKYTRVDGR